MHQVTYSILKDYKGIFKKRHAGNASLLSFTSDTHFIILNLLGKMTDGSKVGQVIVKGPVEQFKNVIDSLKQDPNFVEAEDLTCKTTTIGTSDYKIVPTRKGKYLLSPLNVSFQMEYSGGDQMIYFIKGKINIIVGETLNDTLELKISAKKNNAKMKTIQSRLRASMRK